MQSDLSTALIATLLTGAGANCAAVSPNSMRCKIVAKDITVSDSRADFNYSPSGVKGGSGHVSLFRLLTLDASDGETSSVELKTVDATAPGDYTLSIESLWRSVSGCPSTRQGWSLQLTEPMVLQTDRRHANAPMASCRWRWLRVAVVGTRVVLPLMVNEPLFSRRRAQGEATSLHTSRAVRRHDP